MKIDIKKLLLLVAIFVAMYLFDQYNLIVVNDVRYFNVVAEAAFTLLAAALYLSIDSLRGKPYYSYLKLGFLFSFVSMSVDLLDQFFLHGETHTAIGEKFTLLLGFSFIFLGVRDWIKDHGAMNKQLHQQVITDDLTGLYNRRGLLDQFELMRNKARTEKMQLSIIIADLDDFKEINDTLGHLTGDAILTRLGESLLRLMKPNQVIGRWGGEEFAICVLGESMDETIKFAETIRQAVTKLKFRSGDGNESLTVSLGVAQLNPNEYLMDAVKRADRSLYRAKNNGKNQVFADGLSVVGETGS